MAARVHHMQGRRVYERATSGISGTPPRVTAEMFVNGYVPESQAVKGPPKMYHKKSRNGCQRCRSRRVKVKFIVLHRFILALTSNHYRVY